MLDLLHRTDVPKEKSAGFKHFASVTPGAQGQGFAILVRISLAKDEDDHNNGNDCN